MSTKVERAKLISARDEDGDELTFRCEGDGKWYTLGEHGEASVAVTAATLRELADLMDQIDSNE